MPDYLAPAETNETDEFITNDNVTLAIFFTLSRRAAKCQHGLRFSFQILAIINSWIVGELSTASVQAVKRREEGMMKRLQS